MHIPAFTILACIPLALGTFVYNPAYWPPINGDVKTGLGAAIPSPNATYSAAVILNPNLPAPVPLAQNPQSNGTCPTNGKYGPDGTCWWTCGFGTDGFPCSTAEDVRDCQAGKWGLAVDDGPTNRTDTLLDILKERKLKATFCLVGSQVMRFPEQTLRIFNEGHDLCIHTWSHSPLTTLTNDQIIAELKWTELAIQAVTNVKVKYFRPPYGDIDNRVRAITTAMGYKVLLWKYDTSDFMAFPGVVNPKSMSDLVAGLNTALNGNWPNGLVSVGHPEKADIGIQFASQFYDTAAKKVSLVPVSVCLNDAQPFQITDNNQTNKPLPALTPTGDAVQSRKLFGLVALLPIAVALPFL